MNRRVLLVNGNRSAAAAVSGILEGAGYKVEAVDSPCGIACAFIRFKPRMVLMDLDMPGLGGTKAIELLTAREYDFEFGIVVHSSGGVDAMKKAVCLKGVCGFIPKDITGPELVRDVGIYMDQVRPSKRDPVTLGNSGTS